MLENKEIKNFKDNTEIEMYGILNRVETALQNIKKAEISEHGFFDEYAFNEKTTYHKDLNADMEEEKPKFTLKSWVDEDTDKTENIYALLTEDYDPLAELTFNTADNGYKIKPVFEIFSEKSSPITATQPLTKPSVNESSVNEVSFIEDFEISVSEEPSPVLTSQPIAEPAVSEEPLQATTSQPVVEPVVPEEPSPVITSQPAVETPVSEEPSPVITSQPAVGTPVSEEPLPVTTSQPVVEPVVPEEPLPVTTSQPVVEPVVLKEPLAATTSQPVVEPVVPEEPSTVTTSQPVVEPAVPEEPLQATTSQPVVEPVVSEEPSPVITSQPVVEPAVSEEALAATTSQPVVEPVVPEEPLPVITSQPVVEPVVSKEPLQATTSQPAVEAKKGFTVADLKIEETERYLAKQQRGESIGTLTANALRDADFIETSENKLSTEKLNFTEDAKNIIVETKLSLEKNTTGEKYLNNEKIDNEILDNENFLRLLDRKPKVVAKNIEIKKETLNLEAINKGNIETKEKSYDDKEINVLDFSALEPEAAIHLLNDDFTKELEKNYIEARNNELDKIAAEEKEQVKREAAINGEINRVAEIEKLISKQIIGLLADDLALAPLLNKIEKAVETGVLKAFKKIMKNITFKDDDD